MVGPRSGRRSRCCGARRADQSAPQARGASGNRGLSRLLQRRSGGGGCRSVLKPLNGRQKLVPVVDVVPADPAGGITAQLEQP